MYGLRSGEQRFVVKQTDKPLGIPYTTETEVMSNGTFRLVRLQVTQDAGTCVGSFPGGKALESSRATLAALNVNTRPDGDRLMALAPQTRARSVHARVGRYRFLQRGQSITTEWDKLMPLCGVDVTACENNPAFQGLTVEYRDATGVWKPLGATEVEPFNFIDVEGPHLVRRDLPAFRLRSEPGPASGIRVTRTGRTPLRVAELIVYVTPAAASGTLDGRAHE